MRFDHAGLLLLDVGGFASVAHGQSGTAGTLKVFILGQSNMPGSGFVKADPEAQQGARREFA